MNTTEKHLIVNELKRLKAVSSQNKLAKKAGVSSATISQMLNENWELIRDEMWNKVKSGLNIQWDWRTAETTNYLALTELLRGVQGRSISVCVSHDAGAGKTHTYRDYASNNENVFVLECKNYWTKKIYLKELNKACGLDDHGKVEDLVGRFLDYARTLYKPLFVLDQIDKLKDPSLDLFMDFYNELDGQAAFLLSGVPALKKRIDRGCALDKIGYKELKSRIGRRYIRLKAITEHDVRLICNANGVTDDQFITEAYNDCEGDLRRVKRNIDQYFLMHG